MADTQQTVSIVIDTQRRNGAAIDQTQASLRSLANVTNGASHSSAALTKTTSELATVLGQIPGPLGRATQAVSGMANSMTSVASATTPATAAIVGATSGVVALGGALFTASRYAANFQEQIDIAADRTGLTTSEIHGLKAAAAELGRNFNEIEPAIDFFARKVGEAARGNEDAQRAFTSLGVSLRGANGEIRPTGELLREVGEALRQVDSRTERAAKAFDLFGRSGTRVLGVLVSDWKELNVLSEKTEDQLRELDTSFDRLGKTVEIAKVKLLAFAGVQLLPLIQNLEGVLSLFERIAGVVPKTTGGFGDVRREESGLSFDPLGPSMPSTDEWVLIGHLASERAKSEQKAAEELERQTRAIQRQLSMMGPRSSEFYAEWAKSPYAINDPRAPIFEPVDGTMQGPVRESDFYGTIPGLQTPDFTITQKELEALQKQTVELSGVLESATTTFFAQAIGGFKDMGQAFKSFITSTVASLLSRGLFGGLLGGFQAGGTIGPPLHAQSGMLLSGVRGSDTVPILAGRGETIISHALTDRLDRFLMAAQRGTATTGRVAPPVNLTFNLQSNVTDRQQLRAWLEDDVVPVLRRSLQVGSVRSA